MKPSLCHDQEHGLRTMRFEASSIGYFTNYIQDFLFLLFTETKGPVSLDSEYREDPQVVTNVKNSTVSISSVEPTFCHYGGSMLMGKVFCL
jgi:hypothetical protein